MQRMLARLELVPRLTLREEGQVELLGRRLTDLAPARLWQAAIDSVNGIFANRRFELQERRQLFIIKLTANG